MKEKIEVLGRQGRKVDQLRLLNSDNSSLEGLKERAYCTCGGGGHSEVTIALIRVEGKGSA